MESTLGDILYAPMQVIKLLLELLKLFFEGLGSTQCFSYVVPCWPRKARNRDCNCCGWPLKHHGDVSKVRSLALDDWQGRHVLSSWER